MDVFKEFCNLQNDEILIRPVQEEDWKDLLEVYSDKQALPFFNSDNCDGDIFYYETEEKMKQALNFWKTARDKGWFTRLSIMDRQTGKAAGTMEVCLRVSKDSFDQMAVLRVDVKSDYEKEDFLYACLELVSERIFEWFDCKGVITKVPDYAIERNKAIKKAGYQKTEEFLQGKQGEHYSGYWIKEKN